jgi:HEAT repeat protein
MIAMAYIGPDAAPTMISILSGPDQPANAWSMDCIRNMGTNARPLVPVLVQRLQSTNLPIAMRSAYTLGETKLAPDLVVPALIKALQDPRFEVRLTAASVLARFGELARLALPALTNALNDPNPDVRFSAANAIRRIAPETPTNAPAR